MADPSAKNFGIAGIFLILLLLATLMLFGFLTYLAWDQGNPGPSATPQHSGQMLSPKQLRCAPAILIGPPPIPPATTRAAHL